MKSWSNFGTRLALGYAIWVGFECGRVQYWVIKIYVDADNCIDHAEWESPNLSKTGWQIFRREKRVSFPPYFADMHGTPSNIKQTRHLALKFAWCAHCALQSLQDILVESYSCAIDSNVGNRDALLASNVYNHADIY